MARPGFGWHITALVLCLCVPRAGAAQATPTFQDLPRLLKPGDRIVLVDLAGQQITGQLERLTPTEVVVTLSRAPGDRRQRRFGQHEIRRITRERDSLANGLLIGFAAGAGFGCTVGAGFSGETRAGDCVAGALMFGAIGLALGLGLDALSATPALVYERADQGLLFAPLVSPHGVGARAVLTW